MKPTEFPEQTTLLGPPRGVELSECDMLPVCLAGTREQPMLVSCWELSDEDLAALQRDRRVWLIVYSQHHPMVGLSAESPFVVDQEVPS